MDDILVPLKKENEWKILIVDEFAMKVISHCFKTEEVMACNIALIENLDDIRERIPYLAAIYMITPSIQSVNYLEEDLHVERPKYKNAHLIFLSAVPGNLFNDMAENIEPEMILTLKEIDICFLPVESQVYSLKEPEFFKAFYNAYHDLDINQYKKIAQKLVSLFSTLEEIPLIRYRRNFVKNLILAETIQQELDLQKDSFKQVLESKRNKSQLLILDRGFDCISPIIHEFTFQAMAYDLLDLSEDIYEYALEVGRMEAEIQSTPLTEEDPLWCKLRHEHIANVARIVQNMIEAESLMKAATDLKTKYKGLPSLGDAIKEHLLQKANESFYSYRHMANELMKNYCAGINVLSQLEQDLAIRKDSNEKPVKNIEPPVMAALANETHDIMEKLRLLLLFIFYKKGVTKQNFDNIVRTSGISLAAASTITNILHLDIDIFRPSAIDGTLSKDLYPFLDNEKGQQLTPVERTGYWCVDKKNEKASRLFVFIVGGVTYSEMRCAYEVMKKYTGWEIFVGGDDIITPNSFIEKLQELHNFITYV
ncbi:Syntaxin-binding protein 1 like protein [Argiope bruennichi]|uniref:Syntaxin-binding protein 1 like protein n=1 Tax=Argiope bruennichi TaxID=94029 RepID=A0A8T0FG80_ARGBR|nr:Syntaxin-binding protein 1 like protein [Argiope bruennichi]